MRFVIMAVACSLALACNKGGSSGSGGGSSEISAKDLQGNWKINIDEVKKQADALEKAGKKEDAMGLAMMGATQMQMKFTADGKAETRIINPFSDKGEAKVENSTFVVASAKGDTLNLNITDAKGTNPISVTIKGDALTMTDGKTLSIPFTREK